VLYFRLILFHFVCYSKLNISIIFYFKCNPSLILSYIFFHYVLCFKCNPIKFILPTMIIRALILIYFKQLVVVPSLIFPLYLIQFCVLFLVFCYHNIFFPCNPHQFYVTHFDYHSWLPVCGLISDPRRQNGGTVAVAALNNNHNK